MRLRRDFYEVCPSRRAFTLIELLVVVTIVVLLLATLLPALGRSIEVAQTTACRSNFHQLGVAMNHYIGEESFYPNAYTGGTIVWAPEVRQYTDNVNLFWCPTATEDAKWTVTYGSHANPIYGYAYDEVPLSTSGLFSYGHNNGGSADGTEPSLGMGDYVDFSHATAGWVRFTLTRQPSDFICLGDSTPDGLWDHFIDEDYTDGSGRTEYPAARHDNGANILFADGHAELIQQKYLINITPEGTVNDAQRRRWNHDHEAH